MILTQVPWVLAWALSVGAAATGEVVSVVWLQTGRDASGDSGYERFQAGPGERAKWETVSNGALCASEGGVYRGSLGKSELEALAKAARVLVREQKGQTPNARGSSREIRFRLTAEAGGKVEAAAIARATAGWDPFQSLMNAVKVRMAPESAVRMSAKREGRSVRVKFELLGPESFHLVFPAEAAEAFRFRALPAGGGPARTVAARYLRAPKRKVALTATSPRMELFLGPVPPVPAEVLYSNTAILHHGADPLMDSDAPRELSLCAGY